MSADLKPTGVSSLPPPPRRHLQVAFHLLQLPPPFSVLYFGGLQRSQTHVRLHGEDAREQEHIVC